jgi:SAM-dependent methyltransferase
MGESVGQSFDDFWSNDNVLSYHTDQWRKPKQQTIEFSDFISGFVKRNSNIIDLGCGAGAPTYFIARNYTEANFLGIDKDPSLIRIANDKIDNTIDGMNIKYKVGDIENSYGYSDINGVISLQTLSWLEGYEKMVENVYLNLSPDWFAVTSLFYPGSISAKTNIIEHKDARNIHYNTYSIPEIERFSQNFGYILSDLKNFEINFDINPPKNLDRMGTFTNLVKDGESTKRLQISGPLLMNWYFLLFRKNR